MRSLLVCLSHNYFPQIQQSIPFVEFSGLSSAVVEEYILKLPLDGKGLIKMSGEYQVFFTRKMML